MAVLVTSNTSSESRQFLAQSWAAFAKATEPIRRLTTAGRFAALHLDLFDGEFDSIVWDDGGGPDDFELEIGNQVAYSVPLWQKGKHYDQLKARWLPYYEESLRSSRLEMVRAACFRDLDFVPFYVDRGLYFQAFDRLYKTFREFLQALFISRRIYPIAYNKWIRYQVSELLSEPALYGQLSSVLEVPQLEGSGLLTNGTLLRDLVTEWTFA
jgi:hypothetical protein